MRSTLIILLAILIISCNRNNSDFIVTGKFKDSAGEKIELRKDSVNKKVVIDSAQVSSDGSFKLTGKIDAAGIYSLAAYDGEYIYLIIHPGDRINIEITGISPIPDYYIQGSFDSELIKKLVTRQNKVLSKINMLSNDIDKAKENPETYFDEKKKIDKSYDDLMKRHKKFSVNFIKDHCNSLVTILVLEQQFGIHEKPFFDIYRDIDIFNMVDSCLTASYPHSEVVKKLNHFVAVANDVIKNKNQKSVVIHKGLPAPEIALPDLKGDTVRLSDLHGEKVLLNFWASWNIASVRQIKGQNKWLEDENDLVMFYVSLDKKYDYWKKTSDSLKLSKYNVCDMNYWDSETVRKYKVRILPSNFLIDEKGIIVGINMDKTELISYLKNN